MSRLSDHIQRDAEDAARARIRIQLNRFQRRMYESAKADIQLAIESAEAGEVIDGLTLGQEAGERAFSHYIGPGEPQPALEAPETSGPADEAATDFGF